MNTDADYFTGADTERVKWVTYHPHCLMLLWSTEVPEAILGGQAARKRAENVY